MGFGFYGRSFTMTDVHCATPGCTFAGAGSKGLCSGEAGILTYAEIAAKKFTLNQLIEHYDPVSTVNYMQYSGNQWISYDNKASFKDKMNYLFSRCLSGLMIWAVDQDTQDNEALAALLGDSAVENCLMPKKGT
jgi:GH18 family chitinase